MSSLPTPVHAVYTADLSRQCILYASPDICRITGYQSGEYLTSELSLLYHQFDRCHRQKLLRWIRRTTSGLGTRRTFRGQSQITGRKGSADLSVSHEIMVCGASHRLLVGHLRLIAGQDNAKVPSAANTPRGMISRIRAWRAGTPLVEAEVIPLPPSTNLSTREQEVLFLIADGLTAREIAQRLFISESTVVSHRKNLLRKYVAKNTAELVKLAGQEYLFG